MGDGSRETRMMPIEENDWRTLWSRPHAPPRILGLTAQFTALTSLCPYRILYRGTEGT